MKMGKNCEQTFHKGRYKNGQKSTTSLIIKEIQSITTMRYYYQIPSRMAKVNKTVSNDDEDVEHSQWE